MKNRIFDKKNMCAICGSCWFMLGTPSYRRTSVKSKALHWKKDIIFFVFYYVNNCRIIVGCLTVDHARLVFFQEIIWLLLINRIIDYLHKNEASNE